MSRALGVGYNCRATVKKWADPLACWEGRLRWPRPILATLLLAQLAATGGSAVAWAQEVGEPIHIEYQAAEGCPLEADFVARVLERSAAARLVARREATRTFIVNLETGSPPSGSVTVTEGDHSQGARRLEADSCEHVADALALIVALALDPHAVAAPNGSTEAPPTAHLTRLRPSLPPSLAPHRSRQSGPRLGPRPPPIHSSSEPTSPSLRASPPPSSSRARHTSAGDT
jgi:hypothetical protein